ncbi:MAG: hypothetical protein IJA77_04140 [Clostridia bacterium]|nr:hypothetical protein [Clostridia bacterium]
MSNIRIILGGGQARSAREILAALDGMTGRAPVINVFLPPRGEAAMLQPLLEGLAERRLNWRLTEVITLTEENVPALPGAIAAAGATIPPAQEVWLCTSPEASLRYDRLRPALNAALDACRHTGQPQLRYMDLPLCAADERHWGLFATRQERRRLLSFPVIGLTGVPDELQPSPVCSGCLAGGYCPGLRATDDDASLTCLPAGDAVSPLLLIHGEEAAPLLHLSRYADVSMDTDHLRLRNRLYGAVVTLAASGAMQQRLLGALRCGVSEAQLLSLLRDSGAEPSAFESMLQGCVIE